MIKRLIKLLLVVAFLVGLHIYLDWYYDISRVKEYFERAIEIEICTEGSLSRDSLRIDATTRAEILKLVRTGDCFRHLGGAAAKHVVANDVILHLPDGKDVVIAVSRFPCLVVDNHLIAVCVPLYNKLLGGGR